MIISHLSKTARKSKRYKQLQCLVEDSLGQEQVPPDLPPDDKLIAAGAAAAAGVGGAGTGAVDAEALAALKGKCMNRGIHQNPSM